MKHEELRAVWYKEEQMAFSGWEFSHLNSRWYHEPLPWNYKAIIEKHLQPSDQLLDIGTGGGEFLLSLEHPYENTSVTEAWAPNVLFCKERLTPLGIQVYPVSDNRLPMEDSKFDIVLNQHASYDLQEVSRVLKPGGMFITQQVGGDNCVQFAKRLNPNSLPIYSHFSLSTELPKFEASGFTVKYSDETYPELRFFDVGAVVFWAKVIEWSFPDFSVNNNIAELCSLQDELMQKGFISAIQHRFIVLAQNMK